MPAPPTALGLVWSSDDEYIVRSAAIREHTAADVRSWEWMDAAQSCLEAMRLEAGQ